MPPPAPHSKNTGHWHTAPADSAAAYPWAVLGVVASGACRLSPLLHRHHSEKTLPAHGLHIAAAQAHRALFRPFRAGVRTSFLVRLPLNRPNIGREARPAWHHRHAPTGGHPHGAGRDSGLHYRQYRGFWLCSLGNEREACPLPKALCTVCQKPNTAHIPVYVSSTRLYCGRTYPRNIRASTVCTRLNACIHAVQLPSARLLRLVWCMCYMMMSRITP